ncbi:hypothetical protein C8R43DRAFT_1123093 [Mycena crocata]|nr:hypothetical protein C8R43DRAFT_1123093 [Mycena crocata]
MSSPASIFDAEEDATLHKVKQMFLQHLETVDTSDGLANTLVVKFRLEPEIEAALDVFVTEHGCSMQSRVISREEQDKIDKRRKTALTPEAQEEYLKTRKTPVTRSSSARASPKKAASNTKGTPRKATASRSPTKSPRKTTKSPRQIKNTAASKAKPDTPESEEIALPGPSRISDEATNLEEDMLHIPRDKFNSMCARLADALVLLPTIDDVRATECKDALIEVEQEMLNLQILKRRLGNDPGAEDTSVTPKRSKRPRH